MTPASALIGSISVAFLAFQVWAVSQQPRLRDLPVYLAFGAVMGAALALIL